MTEKLEKKRKRRREWEAWKDVLAIGGCAFLVLASIQEGLLGAAWSAGILGLLAVVGYVMGEVVRAREARRDQVDGPGGKGGGAGEP